MHGLVLCCDRVGCVCVFMCVYVRQVLSLRAVRDSACENNNAVAQKSVSACARVLLYVCLNGVYVLHCRFRSPLQTSTRAACATGQRTCFITFMNNYLLRQYINIYRYIFQKHFRICVSLLLCMPDEVLSTFTGTSALPPPPPNSTAINLSFKILITLHTRPA